LYGYDGTHIAHIAVSAHLGGSNVLRKFTSCLLMVVVPAALFAADSFGGMLYASGATWLNGNNVPRTSAIFPGDTIQTRADSAARIATSGSSLVIHPDSVVRFRNNGVQLDQGGVLVSTSKGTTAVAGSVTIKPKSNGWTEFEVTDHNGAVQISTHKGEVLIADASGKPEMTLPQGTTTQTQSQTPSSTSGGTTAQNKNFFTTPKGIALIGGVALAVILAIVLSGGGSHSSSGPIS
jgi:hypothetical protein